MKPSAVLYGGAEYLRAHGWLKGRAGKDGGPRCAYGAILSVAGERRNDVNGACIAFYTAIDPHGVIYFNDAHCKSVDDAIAALEIAADIAAAEGK